MTRPFTAKSLFLVALTVTACALPEPSAVPTSSSWHWLEGTWEFVKGDIRTVERWERGVEGLRGTNTTWKDGEPVHRESLKLLIVDGIWVYRASPEGQESNDFRLVSRSDRAAVFEDPEHDWPQRIAYAREGEVLRAVASGIDPGSRSATWTWRRVAAE